MTARVQPLALLRAGLALLLVLLAALDGWAHRFDLSTDDAISYLDLADAWARGDVMAAVNGHWAPLYSWLIAVASALVQPSPTWAFALLKGVNLLGVVASIAAFDVLLRGVARRAGEDGVPTWCLVVSGYALFAWSMIRWINVRCDTPDILAMALALGAGAVLVRMAHDGFTWPRAAGFGAMLAVAYLAKYAMMPVALVFLLTFAWAAWRARAGWRPIALALFVFAIVSGPHVALLSLKYGRFTFSESGRFSYAVLVNPGREAMPDVFWQGGPEGFGTPRHPPRVIHEHPSAFEFAGPILGTYPPWLDPVYWNDGLQVRFNFQRQAAVMCANLVYYLKHFLALWCLGFLAVVGLGRMRGDAWLLGLPAAAGLGLYGLVTYFDQIEYPGQSGMRYIAPFVILLALALAGAARFRAPAPRTWPLFAACSVVAVFLGSWRDVSKDLRALPPAALKNDYARVADEMLGRGLRAGDGVAVLGIEPFHEYWARLARVRIVAQLPDFPSFWKMDAAARREVLDAMAAAGARAVVAGPEVNIPESERGEAGWKRLSAGRYGYAYVLLLANSSIPTP